MQRTMLVVLPLLLLGPGPASPGALNASSSALLPPCRNGTYPKCYPASAGAPLGYACVVKAGADKVKIGAGITWACGAGGVDCSAISGANPPGICWDPTKSAADQDVAFFGNVTHGQSPRTANVSTGVYSVHFSDRLRACFQVVFGNYWKLHCSNSKPPPPGHSCPGPGSPSAGSCDFGGVAELVKAPVIALCQHGPPGPPLPPGPPAPPPPP